jgi:ABC-type dipeptide/oligopeptide/nickel transport system permease subunit
MLDEFREVLRIQEGAVVEYKGREFVEDESVMGASEKMIFYMKEMVSNVTHQPA